MRKQDSIICSKTFVIIKQCLKKIKYWLPNDWKYFTFDNQYLQSGL
jgi:hypothetical protein